MEQGKWTRAFIAWLHAGVPKILPLLVGHAVGDSKEACNTALVLWWDHDIEGPKYTHIMSEQKTAPGSCVGLSFFHNRVFSRMVVTPVTPNPAGVKTLVHCYCVTNHMVVTSVINA